MLTVSTKQELQIVLKGICHKYHFTQIYLAQKIGKRRHYLVGYGDTDFTQPNHVDITENIAFFWQGQPSSFDIQKVTNDLNSTIKRLEEELQ